MSYISFNLGNNYQKAYEALNHPGEFTLKKITSEEISFDCQNIFTRIKNTFHAPAIQSQNVIYDQFQNSYNCATEENQPKIERLAQLFFKNDRLTLTPPINSVPRSASEPTVHQRTLAMPFTPNTKTNEFKQKLAGLEIQIAEIKGRRDSTKAKEKLSEIKNSLVNDRTLTNEEKQQLSKKLTTTAKALTDKMNGLLNQYKQLKCLCIIALIINMIIIIKLIQNKILLKE